MSSTELQERRGDERRGEGLERSDGKREWWRDWREGNYKLVVVVVRGGGKE